METADYISTFWSAQEMGVQALMLYLTVSSGYLVVAYLIGAQLTKSQTLFISTLFCVFAVYALWGVGQYWTSGYMAQLALDEKGVLDSVELNHLGVNPALIALPMGFLGILGSLKFMWDVRH
ncbi:MAG: hypothetical protein R3E64_09385 [Halioglobus sp.]